MSLRPIVRRPDFTQSRDLYLVRSHFGESVNDCVSFALSHDYRISGEPKLANDGVAEIASECGKIIYLYKALEVGVYKYNQDSGTGYIFLHEDLDGNNTLIAWKNPSLELVTTFGKYNAGVVTDVLDEFEQL